MKVDFHLTEKQELIILILRETGEVSFSLFYYIYDQVKSAVYDFGEHIRKLQQDGLPNSLLSKFEFTTTTKWLKDVDEKGLRQELRGLTFIGLVCFDDETILTRDPKIALSSMGKGIAERVANGRQLSMRTSTNQRTSIFIACAFGRKDVNALFCSVLEPACKAAGLQPYRIDLSEPPQTITHAILEGISDAECVIADLTYARPSVYFEVGFAHGLGVPLLLTCRKDHYRGSEDHLRVHFDLEQFKISFWTREEDSTFAWPTGMAPTERLSALIHKKPPRLMPNVRRRRHRNK